MPMYTWKCEECGDEEHVVRKVQDIEVPPDRECICGKCKWCRVMCAPQNRWRFND